MLIQGSSRAWLQISTKAMDSSLHINSYNLGMDGYNFLMQYYRFKLYQAHNKKPACIIQNVDTMTLDRRDDLYDLEQFLPYLDVPLIKEAAGFYDGFEYIDYLVPSAKYRHSKISEFLAIKGYLHPYATGKYKGFLARDSKWDDSFSKFKSSNPAAVTAKVDPFTNKLFNDFASYCKINHITLVLVWTPEYIEAQRLITNRKDIVSIFKEYSKKYGITFLDYSDSYISYDTKYFYNSQHLNARGVDAFNKILISDLRPLINRQ